jgi:CelD/BcsL family acetyltransferase involved in cellulose biosynthesis
MPDGHGHGVDLRVEVIRDATGFDALEAEWDALVERAQIEHPFVRYDWVRTWWECFGADRELYVLAVRSNARLVALLPLMRTRSRMYGLSVWRLEFTANVHTPRFDAVIAERADEVYALLLDHLHEHAPRWHVIVLPELAESSRTPAALIRLTKGRSLRAGVWSAGASPVISLSEGFDAVHARLPAGRRRSLRTRLRRTQLLGDVLLEVVDDAARLAGALADGFRIEAGGWKGKAGTAIACDENLQRFYTRIAERAARSGTLRLMFLRIGDKRVAFAYCLRQGRTLYLLKTGFDPQYAPHSPFNLLMLRAVEASCREGLQAFDLLGDDEPWKREWTRDRSERRWLLLCRSSGRGLAIHCIKFLVVPWIKRTGAFMRSAQPRFQRRRRRPRVPT